MSLIDDTCDGCGERFDPMGDPYLVRAPRPGEPWRVLLGQCAVRHEREVANLVTWSMPREEARDLLGWLRHNRPIGMPSRTIRGLTEALATQTDERGSNE